MSRFVAWLDRRLYPDHRPPAQRFRDRVLPFLTADAVCLDFGAGRGRRPALDFRAAAARVCGVDVDPVVLSNPLLHEARQIRAGRIPYPDATFDVAWAVYVLEHLAEPLPALREVHRVLKPGGVFLALTPNRRHYAAALARLTPFRLHRLYNERRGVPGHDVFPTWYRANTGGALRALGAAAGFGAVEVEHGEGRPAYLAGSAPTFLLGAAYERLVNGVGWLAGVRAALTAVMRKAEGRPDGRPDPSSEQG